VASHSFQLKGSGILSSAPIEKQYALETFERNSLLRQLIILEPDFLLPRLQVANLDVNETIYRDGGPIDFVYFPVDSVVSSLGTLHDGTTVEIAMLGKESMVGMSALLGTNFNQYWTRMTLGGHLVRVDTNDLQTIFNRNKIVEHTILKSYVNLVTQISQRAVCNARHSVPERFCSWLLMTHDRLGDKELRLTQELIATRLGTRRAGITVAAHELSERNALEYKRGVLHIIDRSIVERGTCECYSVLKLTAETSVPQTVEFQSRPTIVPLFDQTALVTRW